MRKKYHMIGLLQNLLSMLSEGMRALVTKEFPALVQKNERKDQNFGKEIMEGRAENANFIEGDLSRKPNV